MAVDDPQKAVAAPIDVLHIDDDSGFLELTKAFFTEELTQVTITTALGAEDGLAELENDRFHCVVCDYDMPRQNGLEVLEAIRAEYPELPFILYTGKGSEEIAAEAINAGVTG
jgi:DNA-binding NtrC family response regulator